jgi:uncharacterized membrane protein YjjP (DUF1212 family)
MHGSENARLRDTGHRIGRYHHPGLHCHLDVGVPILDLHVADTADHHVVDHYRRIRLQRSDIRDFEMVGRGTRAASQRTG